MNTKLSISNILIGISAIFTIIATMDNSYYQYGMNNWFLSQWQYHIYIVQFFTSQFLHGNFLHLAMNAVFVIIFWNMLEELIGEKRFTLFFIFSVIFIGAWLTLLDNANTIWISGFAMAILAYYTLYLKERNNPDYKWGITAITINIVIGLSPWISLLWHLLWAIAGVLYFYGLKLIKK